MRTLGCVPTCTYEEEELKHQNEKKTKMKRTWNFTPMVKIYSHIYPHFANSSYPHSLITHSFCDSPYPNMQTRLSIALGLKQTVQNSYYGNNHILHI